MRWFAALPLKRKLILATLLPCAAALLLAIVSIAIYDAVDFRRNAGRETTVLADIVGTNLHAALTFDDQQAAAELLRSLRANPQILAARLFDADGRVFAQFARSSHQVPFPQQPGPTGHRFEGGHLLIFHPVVMDGKRIGVLYLQADLQDLYDRIKLFATVSIIVLVGSLLLALWLSTRLQRPVSAPILALAQTARTVAERQDYSARAAAQGDDEVGALTEAFNHMLARIEEQNRERELAEIRLQAQLARLDLLNRITRAIGERQDLDSMFQVVVRSLEDRLPLDFSCICLYDADAGRLVVTRIGSLSHELMQGLDLPEQAVIAIDENGLARCLRGELVYEPDLGDARHPFPRRVAGVGLRALVLSPLMVEDRAFGMLIVARREPDSFTSADCEFLRQLSDHVALASHQARLHAALQQSYDELRQTQQIITQQERLRALGQMASGVAHDINNAISPVALYTDSLLEQEQGLSARAREYLEIIKRAIEDVAHTIGRLREFYRQGEPELTRVGVDLNEAVRQVLDLTRARWSDMPQQRGIVIRVETELATGLPAISGIASEIREALINLVFNAVDAMPEGGTMTLRTRVSAEGDGGQRIQVEVADTGVGMDEETRRRCTEPFYTTKGERGTGLGLATVYGMSQRHAAAMEIDSAAGCGTTVRLSFPLPEAVVEGGAAYKPALAPTQLRILAIDDDPILLKSLTDILVLDGHEVSAANGGQAGIDTFTAALRNGQGFDIIITDLGMPQVDGRAVAEHVKRNDPDTPVILLTGWGERLAANGEVPPGVDWIMSKPPKLRELRETLGRCRRSGG